MTNINRKEALNALKTLSQFSMQQGKKLANTANQKIKHYTKTVIDNSTNHDNDIVDHLKPLDEFLTINHKQVLDCKESMSVYLKEFKATFKIITIVKFDSKLNDTIKIKLAVLTMAHYQYFALINEPTVLHKYYQKYPTLKYTIDRDQTHEQLPKEIKYVLTELL